MKIRMPHEIEADEATVVLTNGHRVHITGSGHIYVYPAADSLGSETYSLKLPTVDEAAKACDNHTDPDEPGYFTITAEHRH